ncbi:MAG: type VII toxin-antitoxin system HepT family RNase toxin [Streptosporangiaceae bacterium]
MVDEDRVLRLLRSIADDTAVLRQEAGASHERRQDPIWLRGVKYTFVTAIEACVDVAQHICATAGWGPPADNGDAVRLLGEHGVLATKLAVSMRKAVGFRNVLVHDYIEVDDSIVINRLKGLGDLEEFVREVAAYITGAQPKPEAPRQPRG